MSGSKTRWYVKKACRGALALASSAVRPLRTVLRREPASYVRALTYHRFGPARFDPFCVTAEDFEAQVRRLQQQGRAVSLEQVQAFVRGEGTVPRDACLVTIDDGLLSTLSVALPILARHGVPAIAFVSSSLIERAVEGIPERYLTWRELRDVADSGVITVGSHAHTHRSLGRLPVAEAAEEVGLSRSILQDRLGRAIHSFAYPFGTRADFNAATDRAVAEAGYAIAFNSMHGSIARGMSLFSLPRVKVEGGESLAMFDRITRGGLDAWRVVDANLWRLQRARREIS